MIEIDGSEKGGSGTILRQSIALAAVLGEEIHICNVRVKRENPGLRPQHLEAVRTAARLTDADLKGAEIGSRDVWFSPGSTKDGKFESEIGSAGSIPLLFMTIIPLCLNSEVELRVRNGGTDTRGAPTINYMKNVFLRALEVMGAKISIEIEKYGYYPRGGGEAVLRTEPSKLRPLYLGEIKKSSVIEGISVSTFLEDKRVSERQAAAARDMLGGYSSRIGVRYDYSNPMQKGSSIALWGRGGFLGSDAIGEPKKSSERVGNEAAGKLSRELDSGATVDVHLADMLVPYLALSGGNSKFFVREISEHLETSIHLAQRIMGIEFKVKRSNGIFSIEKL